MDSHTAVCQDDGKLTKFVKRMVSNWLTQEMAHKRTEFCSEEHVLLASRNVTLSQLDCGRLNLVDSNDSRDSNVGIPVAEARAERSSLSRRIHCLHFLTCSVAVRCRLKMVGRCCPTYDTLRGDRMQRAARFAANGVEDSNVWSGGRSPSTSKGSGAELQRLKHILHHPEACRS